MSTAGTDGTNSRASSADSLYVAGGKDAPVPKWAVRKPASQSSLTARLSFFESVDKEKHVRKMSEHVDDLEFIEALKMASMAAQVLNSTNPSHIPDEWRLTSDSTAETGDLTSSDVSDASWGSPARVLHAMPPPPRPRLSQRAQEEARSHPPSLDCISRDVTVAAAVPTPETPEATPEARRVSREWLRQQTELAMESERLEEDDRIEEGALDPTAADETPHSICSSRSWSRGAVGAICASRSWSRASRTASWSKGLPRLSRTTTAAHSMPQIVRRPAFSHARPRTRDMQPNVHAQPAADIHSCERAKRLLEIALDAPQTGHTSMRSTTSLPAQQETPHPHPAVELRSETSPRSFSPLGSHAKGDAMSERRPPPPPPRKIRPIEWSTFMSPPPLDLPPPPPPRRRRPVPSETTMWL